MSSTLRTAGVTAAMQALDAAWVVRSHHVEYLTPAFADDRIAVSTWVVHFRRVRSLRRYWFVNASTGKVLVSGETDWVFVDRASRRPRSVPADIMRRFPILTDDSGF